jgi:glycine cleavage system H lipoate-binding protein
MTVLLVLACFVVFVTLDYVVTRRRLALEKPALAVADTPALEPAWVAGYRMPDALYYHRGHSWARPLDGDTVLVGIDDFARRLIGPAALVKHPSRGDWVRQGGRAFALGQDGRVAHVVSPVEGEVVDVNRDRHAASEDPYGRGWVLKVKAPNLGENLRNLLSGRASGWRTAAKASSCG